MDTTTGYTLFNEQSTTLFKNEEDSVDAIDFLINPENFRPFNEGLSELLRKKNLCSTSATCREMTDILFAKLSIIHSDITRITIEAWFSGEHRPKIESGYRKQIYEICFALKLSYEESCWFFHHVYYDRAFNCHTIDESVYYYSIKNGLDYFDAQVIIQEINNAPSEPKSQEITSNFTQFVQQRLDAFKSKEEMISFLIQNKNNFNSWNQTAHSVLHELLAKLLPTENGKKEIANLKRTIKRKNTLHGVLPKLEGQKEWGLIIQEIFHNIDTTVYDSIDIISDIEGKNLSSNTFLLEQILYTSEGIAKKTYSSIDECYIDIPYIVKNNFPSKKTMSDVLSEEKVSQSKSYDSIRKLIILLYFYRFWVEIKLGYKTDRVDDEYHIFEAEINDLLYACGYESIYAGNPYEWLFLTASRNEAPLQFFRDCISILLPEND